MRLAILASLIALPLAACQTGGDSLCSGTKRIIPTEPQVAAMRADVPLWRPLAEQIAAHNGSLTKAGCP